MLDHRTRLRVLWLVAIVVLLGGCTSITPERAERSSTPPSVSVTPPGSDTTLGLYLFVDGQIIDVLNGSASTIATWPEPTSPYEPPVQTAHGFVGFAAGRAAPLDLWSVTRSGARRIAAGVGQTFAVSAAGRRIAYGELHPPVGGGSTRLVILEGSKERASTRIDDGAAPAAFFGRGLLFGTGDALPTPPSIWDPLSGAVHRVRPGAAASETVLSRGVLRSGDSGCWYVVSWLRSGAYDTRGPQQCAFVPVLSPEESWVGAIHGYADDGFEGLERNRLVVFAAHDGKRVFRSDALPGAFQIAWEDPWHALVLARESERGRAVYRCDTSKRRCERVWSFEAAAERYAAWIIPSAPLGRRSLVDRGRGYAIWPEHTGDAAAAACAEDSEAWRRSPSMTIAAFGRLVLGWPEASARVVSFDRWGAAADLASSSSDSGALVRVRLQEVEHRCWSVLSVEDGQRARREGLSARVDGRLVEVFTSPKGAASATVIVGIEGRTFTREVVDGAGGRIRLPFEPTGSGFFLILLRDRNGEVFSASGTVIFPGIVAG